MMNVQIFEDSNGYEYYQFETDSNIKYDIRFPLSVATFCVKNYESDIGPESCSHCRTFGTYKGLIITLCGSCSEHLSKKDYICDCNSYTNEITIEELLNIQIQKFKTCGVMSVGCSKTNCIFKTYLQDLPILEWDTLYTDIGDYMLGYDNPYLTPPISIRDYDNHDNDDDADDIIVYTPSPYVTQRNNNTAQNITSEIDEPDDEVVYIPPPYVTLRNKKHSNNAQSVSSDIDDACSWVMY